MFLYSHWCSLPLPTRIKIAAQFGIIKKGSTEVFNNEIKSDGYVIKDIEQALNIDALQAYIGTHETDMMVLWMWLVEKIEGKELTQMNMDTTIPVMNPMDMVNVIPSNAINELEPIVEKPKRGRKPKQK